MHSSSLFLENRDKLSETIRFFWVSPVLPIQKKLIDKSKKEWLWKCTPMLRITFFWSVQKSKSGLMGSARTQAGLIIRPCKLRLFRSSLATQTSQIWSSKLQRVAIKVEPIWISLWRQKLLKKLKNLLWLWCLKPSKICRRRRRQNRLFSLKRAQVRTIHRTAKIIRIQLRLKVAKGPTIMTILTIQTLWGKPRVTCALMPFCRQNRSKRKQRKFKWQKMAPQPQ